VDLALLVIAVKALLPSTPKKSFIEYQPREVTGYMTFTEWQNVNPGGSHLDYEDWLKGV